MAVGASVYARGTFSPKDVELTSIAFDASITLMYAPGTRRQMKNALKAEATPEEIMAVLNLCVARGIESCSLAVPILEEELKERGAG